MPEDAASRSLPVHGPRGPRMAQARIDRNCNQNCNH
jgi:hypothetical protein